MGKQCGLNSDGFKGVLLGPQHEIPFPLAIITLEVKQEMHSNVLCPFSKKNHWEYYHYRTLTESKRRSRFHIMVDELAKLHEQRCNFFKWNIIVREINHTYQSWTWKITACDVTSTGS